MRRNRKNVLQIDLFDLCKKAEYEKKYSAKEKYHDKLRLHFVKLPSYCSKKTINQRDQSVHGFLDGVMINIYYGTLF
jgi:hypothetical protein